MQKINVEQKTTKCKIMTAKTEEAEGIKGEADEVKNAGKKVPSWKEFFQNTTFHGVRYIFDEKEGRFRGICWLLFVLGAVSLFIYQVVDRANAYTRFDSSVNVDVIYQEQIEFPTVTICNHNRIKVTKMQGSKWQIFLDRVFNNQTLSNQVNLTLDELGSRYNLNLTDSMDFLTRFAHKKRDLIDIDSCTWNGEQCDIDRDFRMTMTDMGLCYSFSGKTQDRKQSRENETETISESATISNAKSGLVLVLNLEEYEYIEGTSDLGIKILLHSEKEFPLVGDLGFAVAPGSHTLVAVERTTVSNLPPPWGKCDKVKGQSMSNCMANCRNQQIQAKCGCNDPYLHGLNLQGSSQGESLERFCNVSMMYTCVQENLEQLQLDSVFCNCTIPCEQEIYQPVLSYAQLSQHSINKMILTNENKKQMLSEKFMSAREARQRVFHQIIAEDATLFGTMSNYSSFYIQYMTNLANVLNSPAQFRKKYPLLVNMPIAVREFLSRDMPLFYTIRERNEDKLHIEFKRLYEFKVWYLSINDHALDKHAESEIVGEGGTESEFLIALYKCENITSSSSPLSDCNPLRSVLKLPKRYFSNRIKKMRDLLKRCSRLKDLVNENWEIYERVVSILYGDTTWDLNENPDHIRTRYDYTELNNSIHTLCEGMGVLVKPDVSLKDAIEAAEMMDTPAILGRWIRYRGRILLAIFEDMDWVKGAYHQKMGSFLIFKKWEDKIHDFRTSSIEEPVLEIIRFYMTNVQIILQNIENYRREEVTKYYFASKMVQRKTLKALETLEEYHTKLTGNIIDFEGVLIGVEDYLKKAYKEPFNSTVPLYNDTIIATLEIWRHVRPLAGNHTEIDQILNSLDYREPAKTLVPLVEIMVRDYREFLQGLVLDIASISSDLSKHLNILVKKLKKYTEESELNDNFFGTNFQRVDIFYKDLRYTKVEQKESFAFLSLLSEVGGFMGLLLGASVLTVCELLDQTILYMFAKC